MKTVFNTSMVAHIWAQQSQDSGRNSGKTVFFEGKTIYSYGYHFPMASFVKPGLVLFNSRSYSVTTGAHQSETLRSLPNGIKSFHVPNCVIPNSRTDLRKTHNENLDHFTHIIETSIVKSSRARNGFNKTWQLDEAERAFSNYNNYLIAFKIRRKQLIALPNMEALRKAADIATKKVRLATIKKEKAALVKMTEEIEKWKTGKSNSRFFGVKKVFLRISGDMVETSQGATFPVDHARKAYRAIKIIKAKGLDWVKNGNSIRIGHFQLDTIKSNGNIKAGCHFVEWDEIKRIGEQL